MLYDVRGKYGDVSKSWWVRIGLTVAVANGFTRALIADRCTNIDVTGWS